MSSRVDADGARTALLQRLSTAAAVLLPDPPQLHPEPTIASAQLLDAIVAQLRSEPRPDGVWLLLVALSSSFPTPDEVLSARRRLELDEPAVVSLWLLDTAFEDASRSGSPLSEMDLVVDGVVVDVDYCARYDLHTGIQRVVRETLPHWLDRYDFTLVAWTAGGGAMRALTPTERTRVLEWSGTAAGRTRSQPPRDARLVVPWTSRVVLAEVPVPAQCPRLSALAQFSGSSVVAIGYDCIPIVSADTVPLVEPDRFVQYLSVVKHADRVAAISTSAAAEFRGFAEMLPTQGLRGPVVVECQLPGQAPPIEAGGVEDDETMPPMVLAVGSHEPRKNHLAVLYAAERLWRAGHQFSLRFIGGSGWSTEEFERLLGEMRKAGRQVSAERAVDDAALWSAYRRARFTVFPSLHEGYGLPVAESLACETPVITSDYGSMREIGVQGGVALVDPRDDDQIFSAMEDLLTDDELLETLRTAARGRSARGWGDYATELWDALVGGEQDR